MSTDEKKFIGFWLFIFGSAIGFWVFAVRWALALIRI